MQVYKMRKHIALLFITIFVLLAILPYGMDAQETNQAALVIGFGGGNVEALCIDFTEPEITGYELLVRSGLAFEIDFAGSNGAVCNIEGTGCPASDCFCQCRGGDNCTYWTYWHRTNNEWAYSQVGAPLYPITHGDVEGWVWGLSSITERQPPPDRSFTEICQSEPATETPTSTPKPTVVIPVIPTDPPESPTATATELPTSTAVPFSTSEPTVTTTVSADAAADIIPSPPSPTATTEITDPTEESRPSISGTTLDNNPMTAELPRITNEPDNAAATSLTPEVTDETAAENELSAPLTTTPPPLETATPALAMVPAQGLSDPQSTPTAPTATPVVTIIGALAAVPEEGAAAAPPPKSAANAAIPQTLAPETSWLSYVVFLLICISLGCLLLIGRLRQAGESAK